MRRSHLTKSTVALTIGSLLVLGPLTGHSFANNSQSEQIRPGLPGRRISGGSRSPNTACLKTPNRPVVALMPKSNLGLTLSGHPTLWFSLPAISQDRSLEFGLYDQTGDLVHKTSFSATGEAGVINLSLPETSPPLSVEEDYRWYLSVICNKESPAENLVVTGWVRRVILESSFNERLAVATELERLSIYKESELWYDALTTLAQLRRSQFSDEPIASDLERRWADLLESIELPQVIAAPFGRRLMPISRLVQGTASLQN